MRRYSVRFSASGSGDGMVLSTALRRYLRLPECLVLRLWDCFRCGIVLTARSVDVWLSVIKSFLGVVVGQGGTV